MKLFSCSACQQTVHFENSECTKCGHQLAYLPDRATMTALESDQVGDEGFFVAPGPLAGQARYRRCGNQIDHEACNWAIPETDSQQRFCRACRLNQVIPNLADSKARQAWINLEQNKRRMIYTLLQLGLPVESRTEDPERGLAFAFKQDQPGEERVQIGHDRGLITINIAEADSPFREKTRLELGESYRTLLGHFRHEIGHYYWDRLVDATPHLEPFRKLFGDERVSYEQAMNVHYQNGAPSDWPSRFVSSYASMHPWEDWAESWAHYLHMVDTLDTARSFGLSLRPQAGLRDRDKLEVGMRRRDFDDFDDIEAAWVPLTVALNSLNRSMGLPDSYPFALSEAALRKIRFVHDVSKGLDRIGIRRN
ncbi:MAG TPA: putative zinc-binding peptidase [Terriglobia bacterium]|nr:putative zinc-binding peptidase [Terriglobia bacterium]